MFKRVSVILLVVWVSLSGGLWTVAAQGDPEPLTETFFSADGMLSFQYPEGWETGGSLLPGMAELSNDPALIAAETDAPPPPGSILISILGPQVALVVFREGLPADLAAAAASLTAAVEEAGEEGVTLGEPQELTLGGHPAVRLDATTPDDEGILVLLEFDGEFALVTAVTAPGEFAAFEPTVLAILETITYGAPDGMLPLSSEDGALTLEYPPGWVSMEMAGVISLAYSFDPAGENTAAPGALMLFIHVPNSGFSLFAEAKDPNEAVQMLGASWIEGKDGGALADPVAITVGERDGVRVDYVAADQQGFIVMLDIDGVLVGVVAQGEVDKLDDLEAVALPVIESIQYTPPADTTG